MLMSVSMWLFRPGTPPPPLSVSHFVLSMLSSLDFLVLPVCRQTWKDCLSLHVSQCLLSRLVSVGLLSGQKRSVCCFALSLNELQVRQLTELKQTKLWERHPNLFRRLYETLMPENQERGVEKGQQAKWSQRSSFFLQENSKAQDLIVYTDGSVTKDQSGWGFPVKQGATTIHEDSECSLDGLNLHLDNGGGSSHPCPPLDCLKRSRSDHTCHHPHVACVSEDLKC